MAVTNALYIARVAGAAPYLSCCAALALSLACSEGSGATTTPAPTSAGAGAAGGSSGSSGAPSFGGTLSSGVSGGASAGASSGGTSNGGVSGSSMPNGGLESGGNANGGAGDTAGAAGSGGAAVVTPAASKSAETKLTSAGLSLVSYGGYLNGESFQQDGVITHQGYQYTAFWNTKRHVVLARRQLPSGVWQSFEFSDYTNTADDAHNTISLGVTATDGTLHVAFDHHVNPLHYRRSSAGLLSDPANALWSASSFGPTTNDLGGAVKDLTYPRFISVPGGEKTLLSARIGTSGSGDEYLWEYSGKTHAWTALGKYIDGQVDNINAYLHSIAYTPGGKRLHAAWCWRDTSDAATNHDLLYVYSDDDGRSWLNNAGVGIATTGSKAVTSTSAGLNVFKIGQNRGLINQEHMTVDAAGRVHVLLSHLPETAASNASFDAARASSQYFHYFRDSAGKWTRSALNEPAVAAFRGKLALTASGNLYAVLPDLRILATSSAVNFATWTSLVAAEPGRFFSDPLVDASRLLGENALSVVYATKASGDIYVMDYAVR